MMLFKKLSISILLAIMSSILIQTDGLGDETVTQEARPKGRSLYMGIFGGGGSSDNDSITQSGIALYPAGGGPGGLGPLPVNASGNAASTSAALGGLHVGYEFSEWNVGNNSGGWGLLPAVEFEGYYLGTNQNSQLYNPITRLPNHRFADSFPIDSGVLLGNAVLNFNTPYKSIHPYIGGGVGAAIVSVSNANSIQINPLEAGINHFNSNPNASNWSFAAQAKAGFRVNLVEHLWLFTEYRFLLVDANDYTFGSTVYSTHIPTNKDRLCEQSEPQSYPVVGQARR